ncbi:hypothetical protein BHM03_00048181 [Ensete ventricosum]|nr:hypothetical protein BHM03_00048181 [Ensete ventricosum]
MLWLTLSLVTLGKVKVSHNPIKAADLFRLPQFKIKGTAQTCSGFPFSRNGPRVTRARRNTPSVRFGTVSKLWVHAIRRVWIYRDNTEKEARMN